VPLLDSANYQDPLDLLRRFIPTPFRTRFRVGATSITVETNDFSLLPELPLLTESSEPLATGLAWKLVRDSDAKGLLQEPLHLIAGQLIVITMGTACLLGVDRERRELLGFIGAEVDPRAFQESLVPILCRLSLDAMATDPRAWFDDLKEDSADA
jgi:hypothetical protein